MRVRCLKRWRSYLPGQIYNHPDGAANVLIKRGIAEAAPAEKPKAEPPRRSRRKK